MQFVSVLNIFIIETIKERKMLLSCLSFDESF